MTTGGCATMLGAVKAGFPVGIAPFILAIASAIAVFAAACVTATPVVGNKVFIKLVNASCATDPESALSVIRLAA